MNAHCEDMSGARAGTPPKQNTTPLLPTVQVKEVVLAVEEGRRRCKDDYDDDANEDGVDDAGGGGGDDEGL